MKLYLVSTPIGNLQDITIRALDVLKNAGLVLCEDTRHSRRLLDHYGITSPVSSYHDHNKEKVTEGIIRKLLAGESVALITDAGTPGISDPAFFLVREAIKHNIETIPIPGPSAVTSALVVSGLATDKFCFEGYLPPKKGRKTRLTKLNEEERTIVVYESPHRIEKTLQDLLDRLGDRKVCVAREMTKMYEEFYRGMISEVQKKIKPKGEFTIIVEGLAVYEKRMKRTED